MIQKLIQAIQTADSPSLLIKAVQDLAQCNDPTSIPTLITVLGYNNPAAAQVAVTKLIAWGNQAVEPLLNNLDSYNYGARAYGIRALAAIGDVRALPVLQQTAISDFAPSVRRAAIKGLGTINWPITKDPQILTSVLVTLLKIAQDGDWSIRYAAIASLENLAIHPELKSEIHHQFQTLLSTESDLTVQGRIQLAQSRL